MLFDPLRFSIFRFQSFSLQEVTITSQIRKFIQKNRPPPNDFLKGVHGIKEFGPWPLFKEGCSHKPGATLCTVIGLSF